MEAARYRGDLLIRAKKRAVETCTPLRVLIERGLRLELASSSVGKSARRVPRKKQKIHWIVASGGLPPGLDMADRSSLREWIRSQR
jgi:hypothetical protein